MATDIEDGMTLVRSLPCWTGDIAVEVLGGGLSNLNFTVTEGAKRYVVRLVGDDEPVHNVMRFNELTGLHAAHEVGLTPGLVYQQPGVMVIDFLDGKTYEAADVNDPANLGKIIASLKVLHEQAKNHVFGPCLAFWVFRVLRSYAHLLREGNSRMIGQLDRFMEITDTLEAAAGQSTITFCHNDLLCANFIDTGDKVWIIDWEHCGYGARLFDLANIASNAEMPVDAERALLTAYYGSAPDAALWRRYKAFRAGSHLREAMWSMASEIHLDLDIDYVTYTQQNLDAFEIAYQEFKTL